MRPPSWVITISMSFECVMRFTVLCAPLATQRVRGLWAILKRHGPGGVGLATRQRSIREKLAYAHGRQSTSERHARPRLASLDERGKLGECHSRAGLVVGGRHLAWDPVVHDDNLGAAGCIGESGGDRHLAAELGICCVEF